MQVGPCIAECGQACARGVRQVQDCAFNGFRPSAIDAAEQFIGNWASIEGGITSMIKFSPRASADSAEEFKIRLSGLGPGGGDMRSSLARPGGLAHSE